MSRAPLPPLVPPNDPDAEFQRRMQPLTSALPTERQQSAALIRANRTGEEKDLGGRAEAHAEIDRIAVKRGKIVRKVFLIPERVARAFAVDAAQQGVSETVLMLGLLEQAGYPVIAEDKIDLRKLPRKRE